jgi:fructose 1,6-bisphosphatase
VVKRVISKTLGEVAAVTSTQRLSLMAGRYVGKDDPVMIVRCQSGLPAVGEALEPFAFPHTVAGCMRGSHHAPIMPVPLTSAHPARFDGPPRVVCLGYQLKDGRLNGPRDMFDDPSFDPARQQCNQVMDLPAPPRPLRAAPPGVGRDGVHHHAVGGRATGRPVGGGRDVGADRRAAAHRDPCGGQGRVAACGS